MKSIKRAMSVILAAVLAAGAVTGCGAGEKKQTGETPAGEPAAMGRYKEVEISLPEGLQNDYYSTAFTGKDHQLELYTSTKLENGAPGEANRYLYDYQTWKKDEDWWGNAVLKEHGLNFDKVVYGMDGNYYLSGLDQDYIFHLYRIGGDGSAVELIEEAFKAQEGKSYGLVPRKYAITPEGNILLYGYRDSQLYSPDGEKMFTMMQDFWGTTDDKNIFVDGNDFVTILDGAVVRYSLLDGQVKETIPYDGLQSSTDGISTVMFSDGTGGIYVANETGLAHVNKGGTVWENLIDGSLNSMGMRSMNMRAFMAGGSDDYYGIYTGDMGTETVMYHYTYDPNLASVPPVTLTVYALHDNSTVRQAAALLQKDNPDVRVEFRAALQDDNSSMTEDVIRSLNTELLSGKGADVLILDGLPVDSYIEKGVLMDMREIFTQMTDAPISSSILESFTKEDGSIYEMPARIAIPVVMGDEDVFEAFASMDAMASYQGELPLVGTDTYENLLRLVANLQYKELFGEGLDRLNEDALRHYLEVVKVLGESSDSRLEFTEDEMNKAMTNNNVVESGIRGSAINFDRGMTDGALEYFDSIFSTSIAWAVMGKHPGIEMKSANGVYFPSCKAGINQATKQKETAELFVKYLFSTPVQKENFYDGFPVQTEALELMGASENENTMMVSSSFGNGDYTLTAAWPTKEQRDHVLGMIPQLTVPVTVDEIVMEMIVSESKDYFEGKADSAQAASAISQKIKLYLTE